MEARYRKYIATDPDKATEYLLTDRGDTSHYESAQHYTDNVMCIALPACGRFVETVVAEIAGMHDAAGAPLRHFHIGGDEVPSGAWTGSPLCRAMMQERGMKTTAELKDAFVKETAAIVQQHGAQLMGWEEIALRGGKPNLDMADMDAVCYCWKSVSAKGGNASAYTLANAGHKVVICGVDHLYMDMAYTNHEEERGLHWGGYTDEYSAFLLQPYNLYATGWGERQTTMAAEREQLRKEAAGNLYGICGTLWAETLRSGEQAETYLLPKLFGLAERAWNACVETDMGTDAIGRFHRQMAFGELPRIHRRGLRFHLAQPGIHRDGERVSMNSRLPDAVIRYTTDGSAVSTDSPVYTEPFACVAPLINAKCFLLGEESNTTHSVR